VITQGAHRIIVGTDGSENSLSALRWALREGDLRKATVDVVHVWDYPPLLDPMALGTMPTNAELEASAERVLREVMRRVDADRGAAVVNQIVTRGPAAQSLLSAARGADLLVVGRRGRGGFLGVLLGSVATQVVNHAQCPVVVVSSH
jgi:nucleotide-binding universal stress UspA family protein